MLSRTAELARRVRARAQPAVFGRVIQVAGLLVVATVPGAGVGDLIEVDAAHGVVPCEVVGFRDGAVLAVPLRPGRGLAPGARARIRASASSVPVGESMMGRVVDPFGVAIDGGPPVRCTERVTIDAPAPAVDARAQVDRRFDTGVRAIDALLTCGRGQRVGIFAGAGVGKSVLVEQIATQSFADVIVVGLIGERGREVRELLGNARRDSMVIVAATSDRSPMERARGACAATAIAEHFRDKGANVLLVIDSLTRYAMALREIGLSAGEPPTTKGYPPSVFSTLPRLLERVAPLTGGGSITGFYTVLVEGDDLSDPVADSARSLLDAHVVLSRDLASRGHFPAIDILASASRVARRVSEAAAVGLAERTRAALARRKLVTELQNLGAYLPGNNPAYDQALALGERLDAWARQPSGERSDHETTMASLSAALQEASS